MLGKEITYNDLDGNPITETFWFHLSRAEIAEMALAKEGRAGGFDRYIRNLIESQDGETLTAAFKEIILSTVGQRSEDNKYFDKTDEYTRRFVQSDAYSVLLMELLTEADKMSEFINGVVPKEMREGLEKNTQNGPDVSSFQGPQARMEQKGVTTDIRQPTINASSEPKDDTPEWMKDPNRIPTMEELKGASMEQMQEAFRRKSANSGPVTHEEIAGS